MRYGVQSEQNKKGVQTDMKSDQWEWLDWLGDQPPFDPEEELPRQWREAYQDMMDEAA